MENIFHRCKRRCCVHCLRRSKQRQAVSASSQIQLDENALVFKRNAARGGQQLIHHCFLLSIFKKEKQVDFFSQSYVYKSALTKGVAGKLSPSPMLKCKRKLAQTYLHPRGYCPYSLQHDVSLSIINQLKLTKSSFVDLRSSNVI